MPPKGKRPSGAAEDFLFVNEDFSTLFGGAKNADLDRSKQSHVQRRSFAKRRKGQRGGATSTASSPTPSEDAQSPASRVPLLPFPPSDSLWLPVAQDETAGTTAPVTQSLSSFDESPIALWPTSMSDFSQQTHYPFTHSEQNLSGPMPPSSRLTLPPLPDPLLPMGASTELEDMFSLSPVASTSLSDPFNNIQLALEKWAPPLMRYFTMRIVPEIFHTDLRATSLHTMRHVEYIHQDMRSCMSNPAEMYALLAASACHALRREGKLDLPGLAPENSNRVILLFKSKAFEAIRLRLSSGELSQGIVIAIQRMICAALHTSNHLAMESHYNASLSMIQTIGGLEAFNDFQKERLIIHDLYYALHTGSSPRLELTWDPGELVADVNFELIIYMNRRGSEAGGRIRSIAGSSERVFHPTLAECILQSVETQQVLEWLREGPYQPGQYRWLAHRRLALIHRLLMLDGSILSSTSRVARFALLYYFVMVRAVPCCNHALVDQYAKAELKDWDTDSMVHAFRAHPDLLLWVVVMFGAGTAGKETDVTSVNNDSSRMSSPQEGDSRRGSREARNFDVTTFVARIGQKICKTLGIVNEARLRELMKTFLFDDDFVNESYLSFVRQELSLAGPGV